MRTFKIAICEDDRDQNEHINYMIKKSCIFLSSEHQKFEISNTFYSYESIFQFINSSSKLPDIYFLDIQLSSKPDDKNGIELAPLKPRQHLFLCYRPHKLRRRLLEPFLCGVSLL